MEPENNNTGGLGSALGPVAPDSGQNTPTGAVPPTKKKPVLLIVIIVLVVVAIGVVIFALLRPSEQVTSLRTYFTYTKEDIENLKSLESENVISVEQVHKWEDKAYGLVEEHQTIDVDTSKIYAYLATAQMDAAALSYQAHGAFVGTLDSISKDVLCEFYADSCSLLVAADDEYSKQLASTVMTKVKERIAEDVAQTEPYVLKSGTDYWQGPIPQIGLSAGSFKQWRTKSSDQFRADPPPAVGSVEQRAQLAEVKQTLANATNEQKAIVVEWAGGPGTKTPPGLWLALASHHLEEEGSSLDTFLETRALLTMAMADAVSAVFDSKYTYQYKRPNMFDTSIVTVMPTPNHPSYPAGHATISWAAATVLSKYLPENQTEWERLAKEASDSRTIGGIHFPIDNEAGTTLGKNVGTAVLENW